jgi:hypothetical protein
VEPDDQEYGFHQNRFRPVVSCYRNPARLLQTIVRMFWLTPPQRERCARNTSKPLRGAGWNSMNGLWIDGGGFAGRRPISARPAGARVIFWTRHPVVSSDFTTG